MRTKLWLAGLVIAGGAAVGGTLWAADPEPPADDANDPVAKIALAGKLTEYGRKAKSPASLIDAALILRSIPAGQIDTSVRPQTSGADGSPASAEAAASAPGLIDQAEELLIEAKRLSAARAKLRGADGISDAEAKATVSLADAVLKGELHRGSQGGPKYFQNNVRAGQADTYNVKFNRSQWARIAVRGAAGSKIVLVVRNAAGDVRASDIGQTPQGAFIPHQRDGEDYQIKLTNKSDHTVWYQLYTN